MLYEVITGDLLAPPLQGVSQFGGIDTGGHGDDAVAQYHDAGGQRLPQGRLGGDVAKAHRGQGDYAPVDALGDAGEAILVV